VGAGSGFSLGGIGPQITPFETVADALLGHDETWPSWSVSQLLTQSTDQQENPLVS
jgi:hypothetical protein